jgi:HD-like signal output (HDOD) protein
MKSTREKATPTSSSFIPVVNTITAEDRRHYRTTATATATASIMLPAVPTRRNRDRAYTTKEIRKMLKYADLRSSACASVA